MWGTVILDAYADDERDEIAEALDELCDPLSGYGFASGGIYCYWDPETRVPLYVGRARHLAARFRRHNGLSKDTRGNKRAQIAAHFESHERLGLSVLVRSPQSQGDFAKTLKQVEDEDLRDLLLEDSSERDQEISDAEGIAIRSVLLAQGRLPAWNEISGSVPAWNRADTPDQTTELFTGQIDTLLQARRTLREVADNPTWERFEECLHSGRFEAAARAVTAREQLSDELILRMLDRVAERQRAFSDPSFAIDLDRMRAERYLLDKTDLIIGELHPLRAAQREAWSEGRPIPEGPPPPPA